MDRLITFGARRSLLVEIRGELSKIVFRSEPTLRFLKRVARSPTCPELDVATQVHCSFGTG
jgi:hypothetical protein